MSTKTILSATLLAAMMMAPMAATAGDAKPLPLPAIPAPQSSAPPTYIIPTPEPNGGVTVHGGTGGYKGSITHQPHGNGFETDSGRLTTPGGTSFGGSVTSGPSGITQGSVSFGGNF